MPAEGRTRYRAAHLLRALVQLQRLGEGGGGGGYRDGEETRCFEGGLGGLGRADPVVIIAAVEDEDADLFGRSERKGQKGEQADEPEFMEGFHGGGVIG